MSVAARSAVLAALVACFAAGAAEAVVLHEFGIGAGLALPVGAAAVVVVMRRPIAGAQLALLAVPLEYLSLRLGGEAGLSPTELLLLLTTVAALVSWSLTGVRPRVPGVLAAAAAVCVLIAFGFAVAADKVIVAKILVMWSAFVVVAVLVANAEVRDLARLMACLAIAGGIAGFVAVAGGTDQSLVAGGLIATNRAQAGFAQPNVLGFFLVLAIPSAVVHTVHGPTLQRAAMGLMAVGALWGLMLSLSRTSLVGAAVGLAVLLLWPAFRRWALVGVAALFVFVVLNAEAVQESEQLSVVTQRLATLGRQDVVERDPRLQIYATTPSIIAESPLLGVGAGNYSVAAKRYGVLDHEDSPFDHAHNVPLTIAAEIGIPGLIAFVVFAVMLAGLVRRALLARGDPEVGPLLLAIAAALIGSLVTCLGDYPPRTNAIAATFMILIGALWGLLRARS